MNKINKKSKTAEQFVETFLYRLLRSSQTGGAVLIRFPDGESQLLQIMEQLRPTFSIFDRIHHQGWFKDQSLEQLSSIGKKFIQDHKAMIVRVVDGRIVLNFMKWDYAKKFRKSQNADLNARYYYLGPKVEELSVSIKSSNRFTLSEYGLRVVEETFSNLEPGQETTLAGYGFYFNKANSSWQHLRSFGSKKDFEFCTDSGMCLILRKGYLELTTYADGGMTGLNFDSSDATKQTKRSEDILINYTLKLVKRLVEGRLIEIPKKWQKK